tara:strand:+ start:2186 stop:3487 length:1302 start_codon:yes stop_codon:yes gene_type:complete
MKTTAQKIVKTLSDAGLKAYWAGGCVRDMIMGIEPLDYDIATDARPDQVMKLFKRTIPVGASFGVVKVLYDDFEFEVATFRSDGEYIDGRRPEEVHFSGEKEDAFRRDFTINGIFYDPAQEKIIDYVNGQADIKYKIIRTINDPKDRFSEDRLRLIRAVRFAARFQYEIEPNTYNTIKELAETILQISAERIRDELCKMLTGLHPAESIQLLDEVGILKVILPEVTAMKGVKQPEEFHPEGDVWEHTILMLKKMSDPTSELAMAVLLHDVGKPSTFSIEDRIRFNNHCEVGMRMTEEIGERLRFSKKQVEHISELVLHHLRFKDVQKMRESKLKRFLRLSNFADHLELHRLDCLASHGNLNNLEFCKQKLSELKPEEIKPKPLINGHDLIAMGYKTGPFFKQILTVVEDAILEGRIKTHYDAKKFVQKNFPVK